MTEEPKWTKGPLTLAIGKYETGVRDANFRWTALTHDAWNSRPLSKTPGPLTIEFEEAVANATLYAAAPDLYEATDWVKVYEESVSDKANTVTKADASNHPLVEESFKITLTATELRALIDARRKAKDK